MSRQQRPVDRCNKWPSRFVDQWRSSTSSQELTLLLLLDILLNQCRMAPTILMSTPCWVFCRISKVGCSRNAGIGWGMGSWRSRSVERDSIRGIWGHSSRRVTGRTRGQGISRRSPVKIMFSVSSTSNGAANLPILVFCKVLTTPVVKITEQTYQWVSHQDLWQI